LTGLLILMAFTVAGAGDLNDLKQHWKTSRPILEKIKKQPRKYKDAVSKLNLLGRSRNLARAKAGSKAGIDTVHVLVIKAQFQIDSDTNTAGDGHFDYAGNGQPMYINGDWRNGHNLDYEPPHDSLYIHNQMVALRNYYLKISGGRLWIDFEQWPRADTAAYTLPHQMSFYSDFYNGGENWGAGLYVLLRDAVDAAGNDPGSCSFSTGSGANKIPKAVMVFHAGSCWQTDPYGADLPSVFLQMDESSPIIVKAGADTIYEGILDAETQSQDGMVLGSQGEIAHEFGHQLGLPDLYDYTMYSVGLGEWELMSYGSWNMNAYVPPHISAWCKAFLGWAKLETLKPGADIQVAFKWVADSNAIVKVPINSHEYYLIENRRAWVDPNSAITDSASADSNGARVWRNGVLVKVNDYDMSLPFDLNAGGLLVWHVDDDLIAQRWADNSLETGDIKAIYLLEADHVQDLQRWGGSPYSTYASPYDAYYAGNNDRLDDGSDPPTVANDGSYTHISISGVTAPAESMSARVKVGWSLPGFPYNLGQTVDWNSPNYAILGDTTVLVIPGNDGRIYALMGNGQGLFNHDTTLILASNDTVHLLAEFARVNGNIFSSPAVGDVDKDGKPEVFVTSAYSLNKGYIWGFSFNSQTVQYYSDSGNIYSMKRAVLLGGFPDSTQGPIFSSPTLADINGDDTLEIMAACDDKKLYAWHHDGRTVSGFPRDLTMETRATPSAAELDSSYPGSEIAILSGDSRVFAVADSGRFLPGFPALTPWVDWVSASTAIGDLNRDGSPEIVACPKKEIIVLDKQGRIVLGWPVSHDTIAVASPALGDLDGDGYLEIVVAIGTKLYAYNYNGTLVTGFPKTISDSFNVQSSPVIGDVDDDGLPEIIIGSPDGRIYAFNGNGTNAAGFPLTAGGKILSTPLLVDLDGDSTDIELAVGCDDGHLYAWSIASPVAAPRLSWPMFCGNQAHTGYLNWVPAQHSLPSKSGELINNVYVYPNPARGDKAVIRFYLENSAEVDVKIFSLAGDLVWQSSKTGQALTENEVVWNLKDPKNFASGVYIIRVEANDGATSKVKICKAAVIK